TNERSLQLGLTTTLNTTDPSSRSISVTVTFPYLGVKVLKPNVAHAARRVRTTYTPPSTRGTGLSVMYAFASRGASRRASNDTPVITAIPTSVPMSGKAPAGTNASPPSTSETTTSQPNADRGSSTATRCRLKKSNAEGSPMCSVRSIDQSCTSMGVSFQGWGPNGSSQPARASAMRERINGSLRTSPLAAEGP